MNQINKQFKKKKKKEKKKKKKREDKITIASSNLHPNYNVTPNFKKLQLNPLSYLAPPLEFLVKSDKKCVKHPLYPSHLC